MISLVTLDELGTKIAEMVDEYVEGIMPRLDDALVETANEIIKYIASNAPRSGSANAFADSFIATPKGKGVNKTIVIHSMTEGRIAHLLEFGFVHKSGKFVRPRAFMRPGFDMLTPKMVEQIKEIIEKGSFR